MIHIPRFTRAAVGAFGLLFAPPIGSSLAVARHSPTRPQAAPSPKVTAVAEGNGSPA